MYILLLSLAEFTARQNTQWNDQNLIKFICCYNSFQNLSSYEGVNP